MACQAIVLATRFRSAATPWQPARPMPRLAVRSARERLTYSPSPSRGGPARTRPPSSPRLTARRPTISALGFDQRRHGGGPAPNASLGGQSGQGAAYTYTEPEGGWINATETTKLTASDGEAGDNFGDSVSIDGSTLVVGAEGADSSQGAAYTFLTTPVVTVTDAGGTYSAATFPATGDVTGVSGADLGTPTFTYFSGTYAAAADLTSLTGPCPGVRPMPAPTRSWPSTPGAWITRWPARWPPSRSTRAGSTVTVTPASSSVTYDAQQHAQRRPGQHGNGRRGRVADGDLRGHRRHRLCVIDDGPHGSRRVPGLGQLRGQRGPHGEQQHGRLRHHPGHGHDHGHGLQRRV